MTDYFEYASGEIVTLTIVNGTKQYPADSSQTAYVKSPGRFCMIPGGALFRADDVTDVRRTTLVKENDPDLPSAIVRHVRSRLNLGDDYARLILQCVREVISERINVPPEPVQYSVVEVTPLSSLNEVYFVRVGDLPAGDHAAKRWFGPKGPVSWAEICNMGHVKVLPRPRDDKDVH